MKVLLDTSVWVDFFRRGPSMTVVDRLLDEGDVVTHPMVVVELACGSPPSPRLRSLRDIEDLQHVSIATLGEARELLEREKLYGRGLGLVDLMLLTSTRITPGTRLYSLDRRLDAAARQLGVVHTIAAH